MSKPSEKTMQLVQEIRRVGVSFVAQGPHRLDFDERAIAALINVYTAETLAEHQRVIEMAEKALRSAEYAIRGREHTGFIDTALAEMAKLRKE